MHDRACKLLKLSSIDFGYVLVSKPGRTVETPLARWGSRKLRCTVNVPREHLASLRAGASARIVTCRILDCMQAKIPTKDRQTACRNWNSSHAGVVADPPLLQEPSRSLPFLHTSAEPTSVV